VIFSFGSRLASNQFKKTIKTP